MTKISDIYTKTLKEVNDIPAHTRVRVVSVESHQIVIYNENTGERVRMHQPAWWEESIDMNPIRHLL